MRIGEASAGMLHAAPRASSLGAAPKPSSPLPPVEVWVPVGDGTAPDALAARSGGPTSTDKDVREALRNGATVLEYVRREFGRNGLDDAGSALKLRVHASDPYTGSPNNALWFNDEQRIWLGDGDGEVFKPLGGGTDVIAHEFFHGVIDSELKLDYDGQEGALHESFADVLATGVDGNWQIGERVFTPAIKGDALRDLARLTYTDWRTFPAGEDEVHAMSEVPSHAAYLVGAKLGQAAMRQVWYEAIHGGHLRNHSGFAGARDATIAAARVLYGATSAQAQAVTDAWAAVGIDALTPKELRPA